MVVSLQIFITKAIGNHIPISIVCRPVYKWPFWWHLPVAIVVGQTNEIIKYSLLIAKLTKYAKK